MVGLLALNARPKPEPRVVNLRNAREKVDFTTSVVAGVPVMHDVVARIALSSLPLEVAVQGRGLREVILRQNPNIVAP